MSHTRSVPNDGKLAIQGLDPSSNLKCSTGELKPPNTAAQPIAALMDKKEDRTEIREGHPQFRPFRNNLAVLRVGIEKLKESRL